MVLRLSFLAVLFFSLQSICLGQREGNSLKPKGQAGPELTFTSQGKALYTIVLPAQPKPQETKAAEELCLWLKEMTGMTFPVIKENQAGSSADKVISIGQTTRFMQQTSFKQLQKSLDGAGYAIQVVGQDLYLFGGNQRGTIYAVLALLEEDLGCRWFTKDCSVIPHRPELKFRPTIRSVVPAFTWRDIEYRDVYESAEWGCRNRVTMPCFSDEWGGGVRWAPGHMCHTYEYLIPYSKYPEHPEYYAFINGVRNRNQLCPTNPDVVKIATERCLELLKQHPGLQCVDVSPNDGGLHCACETCKPIDDANHSPAASQLQLCNAIAAELEKKYPNVYVTTLAYQDSRDAPTQIKPRHNVIVRLCNDSHAWKYPLVDFAGAKWKESEQYRETLKKWTAISDNITIWDYTSNFSHYLAPMPNIWLLAPSLKYYKDCHVKGVMFQGNYNSLGGERTLLRVWVMSKLLWDPSLDAEQLQKEFIEGYYGKAAAPILAYNTMLEQIGPKYAEVAFLNGIRYDMTVPFLDEEFIKKADGYFAQAEAASKDPETLRRVKLAKLPILYVKLVRGPEFTGPDYGKVLDEFEAITEKEKVTHLEETRTPDCKTKIAKWREVSKSGSK
jgi:hypothetical protein